jgi:hypothetical protein
MAKWFTVGLPLSLGFEPVKHIGRTYMVTPFGEAGLLIVSQNGRDRHRILGSLQMRSSGQAKEPEFGRRILRFFGRGTDPFSTTTSRASSE